MALHAAADHRALEHVERSEQSGGTFALVVVKRAKNDRADAEAIREAVPRPTMRFVSIKGEEQQALLVLHGFRETLVGQRIQLINTIAVTWRSSASWRRKGPPMSSS